MLDCTAHNHNGIMERAFDLGDKLLSATTHDNRARLGLGAASEQVVAVATDLTLLEPIALAEVLGLKVIDRGLNGATNRLDHAREIIVGDTTGAEDVTISKELRGQITDGQLGQDNLGSSCRNQLQLLKNDAPLRVDNGLVVLIGEDA